MGDDNGGSHKLEKMDGPTLVDYDGFSLIKLIYYIIIHNNRQLMLIIMTLQAYLYILAVPCTSMTVKNPPLILLYHFMTIIFL